MKQIALMLALASSAVLTSCVESSEKYQSLKSQYDSIAISHERIQTDMYQTDSLVASVLANFHDMAHIENMVNVNPLAGEVKKTETSRINENMELISKKLEESSKALDELSAKLSSSQKNNQQLTALVSFLKKEFESRRAHLKQVQHDVEGKSQIIESLDRMIARLRREAEGIKLRMQDAETREKQVNQVHYAIGTTGDLREMRLITKNRNVNVDNAQLDYLTQADRRELKEIQLMSDKATILSPHPRGTYELVPNDKKALVLKILDPKKFWTYSQVLIVEVDN